MELLFRRYFWSVTAAFGLAVAFLLAKTVNLFVEAAVAPSVTGSAVRPGPRLIAPETYAALNGELLARLTGLPVPKPVELSTGISVEDPNAAPVKTSLGVKLLGTLLASNPAWSLASIQDSGTQKAQTYMVGDLIMSAEILEINRSQVIIRNGGRREYIDSEAGSGAPPPMHIGAPVGEPGTNVTGSGIHAVSENDYEVPRAEVDKTLSNLNDVAMQARIVPSFKDGQANGFKLFSIRPDSIYSKIGVQNGDVIKRINGYDMNSPEKALEVYSKLKESNRIEIDIDRNGSSVHKTYNIH